MKSTQNWEVDFEELTKYGDTTNTTVERSKLKSFTHSVEEKAREREWKRCIDVIDRDHSKCPIPESCIGYQNAQSDLINNPPITQ